MTQITDKTRFHELMEQHPNEWINEIDIAMELDISLNKVQFLALRTHDIQEDYIDGVLFCRYQPGWSVCKK